MGGRFTVWCMSVCVCMCVLKVGRQDVEGSQRRVKSRDKMVKREGGPGCLYYRLWAGTS